MLEQRKGVKENNMELVEVVFLGLAIILLLAKCVMQDNELKKIKEDVQFYKDDTEKYENRLLRRICQCENTTKHNIKELDDMYQNLNSRMNKHMIEHIMKGGK